MVGRLVQKDQIRLGGQYTGECCAPRFAARQMSWVFLARQPQFAEQIAGTVRFVAGSQARLDIGENCFKAGEIGLLRQVAHGRIRLEKTSAAIHFDQSGGDFQQGGFARAVASHKAEPLAWRHRQFRTLQQRLAADGEYHVLQEKDGGSHESKIRKGRALSIQEAAA